MPRLPLMCTHSPTDPYITAIPQTRSKKTPRLKVNPVAVGLGAKPTYGLADRRGPGAVGLGAMPTYGLADTRGTDAGGLELAMASSGASPATTHPLPEVHRLRAVQSCPAQ